MSLHNSAKPTVPPRDVHGQTILGGTLSTRSDAHPDCGAVGAQLRSKGLKIDAKSSDCGMLNGPSVATRPWLTAEATWSARAAEFVRYVGADDESAGLALHGFRAHPHRHCPHMHTLACACTADASQLERNTGAVFAIGERAGSE